MKIIITKNYSELSKKAASLVISQIKKNPKSVLGLPTGSTPLGMYQNLIKAHRRKLVDFLLITTFNLDEYVGLSSANQKSYHYYMFNNLFNHLNIPAKNINIPDGCAKNFKKVCTEYERKIKQAGGIDLQVLGIGRNGHVGFNEPGATFSSLTHLVKLTPNTISANSRFFDSVNEVPKRAITIGLKTIMSAKKIILLASGTGKADIIAKVVKGSTTKKIPASILKKHKNFTLIIDKAAAFNLNNNVIMGQ